jgi:hypothetical protein
VIPQVRYVAGSVRKICQLTGEYDRERDAFAFNRTESRFGVVGTDLGSSFCHGGRLWFLFGDTWPDPGLGDSVAFSSDTDPEQGVHLEFVNTDGRFVCPRVTVPGDGQLSAGAFEVPLAGFSARGTMYVLYSMDHYRAHGQDRMGRSVLTRAAGDDPTDLVYLYEVSNDHRSGKFINVSPVVVDRGLAGLPVGGAALLVWGSGRYRASDPYLACVPLDRVEERTSWRYFTGQEEGSRRPGWSEHEDDATGLFEDRQIGELSVSWNVPLGVWLMLYNAVSPRGIVFRVASQPWGPWSPPGVLFDPDWAGVGYGAFMHVGSDTGRVDRLSDPGREAVWGGEYGPYVVSSYTRPLDHHRAAIYFVMSTWNPYNTVLMTAALERHDDTLANRS